MLYNSKNDFKREYNETKFKGITFNKSIIELTCNTLESFNDPLNNNVQVINALISLVYDSNLNTKNYINFLSKCIPHKVDKNRTLNKRVEFTIKIKSKNYLSYDEMVAYIKDNKEYMFKNEIKEMSKKDNKESLTHLLKTIETYFNKTLINKLDKIKGLNEVVNNVQLNECKELFTHTNNRLKDILKDSIVDEDNLQNDLDNDFNDFLDNELKTALNEDNNEDNLEVFNIPNWNEANI